MRTALWLAVILKSNMAAVDKSKSKIGKSAMREFDEDGGKMHIYYSSFLDRDESIDRYKPDYTAKKRYGATAQKPRKYR